MRTKPEPALRAGTRLWLYLAIGTGIFLAVFALGSLTGISVSVDADIATGVTVVSLVILYLLSTERFSRPLTDWIAGSQQERQDLALTREMLRRRDRSFVPLAEVAVRIHLRVEDR